ncbi:hypothetical protein TrLO_g8892 [Triparma laevis f. longispina]|uniref:Uncharacterized protein n=1 Tax=Triparma laevis f. longispina TaxID=1714387 RepID=A0A9W7F4B8_9STRA|nr:hypothetical protein TrLO_g8892 [Triparma laevis f. longispina]
MSVAQVKPEERSAPVVTYPDSDSRSSPTPNNVRFPPSGSSPVVKRKLSLVAVKDVFSHKAYSNGCLYIGAFLSFADMVSDALVINVFFETDQTSYAYITIASIMLCLTLQALIVIFNYRSVGKRRLLLELFYVVACMKPGIDAYRVAEEKPQLTNAMISPSNEMTFCRTSELFTESIPGACIQSYAIINGKDQGLTVVLSLASSVLSGSFISAAIAYEKDTSKEARSHSPQFYGYIPDALKPTIVVSLLMWVMSACQMSGKAFACALCAVQSRSMLLLFLFAEFFLFVLYKVVRRDYLYWIPLYGPAHYIMSTVVRVSVKFVVDFTGCLHFRHPYELGGFYMMFTIYTTPLLCLYFGSRYNVYADTEEGKEALPHVLAPGQVYTIIGTLIAIQFISFQVFLFSIKKDFLTTFYSTQTGPEMIQDLFNNGKDDREKIECLTINTVYWKAIEGEVRAWIKGKIPEWQESQPEWWNDRFKVLIPKSWLDEDEKRSVRESLTEASLYKAGGGKEEV